MTRRPIRDAQYFDYTPRPERRGSSRSAVLWLSAAMLVALVTLAAVALFTSPAHGQEAASTAIQGSDTLRLERRSDDVAVLHYHNHKASRSSGGPVTLHHDGLTVDAQTRLNVDGAVMERLVVTPPDGWIAYPPQADVMDGESIDVILRRGKWEGM